MRDSGTALGVLTALRVAAAYPGKIARLVLVGGTPRLPEERESGWQGVDPAAILAMRRGIRKRAGLILRNFCTLAAAPRALTEEALALFPADNTVEDWVRGLDLLNGSDLRETLKAIPPALPVTLVHDRDDAVVPIASARFIAAHFQEARWIETGGEGHLLPLRQPALIASLLGEEEETSKRVAAAFGRAAGEYDRWADHHRAIAGHLLTLLPEEAGFGTLADFGCGTGILLSLLSARYPLARREAVDLSREMLDRCRDKVPDVIPVLGEAQRVSLPLPADLIVSATAFQWISDYSRLLGNLRKNLAAGGLLAVAELVEDNLPELRSVEREIGWTLPRPPYRGESEIRACLKKAGFTLIKSEKRPVTVWYPDATTALRTFSKIGADPAGIYGTARPPLGKIRQLVKLYEARFRETERGVPLTYSVFFFSARLTEQCR